MVRYILLFTVLGPYFGAVCYWNLMPLAHNDASSEITLGRIITGLNASFFLAYVSILPALMFGALPSIIAGTTYWIYLIQKTDENIKVFKRFIFGSFLGLLTSSIFGVLFVSIFNNDFTREKVNVLFMWSIPGAVSGGICACLVTNGLYKKCFLKN